MIEDSPSGVRAGVAEDMNAIAAPALELAWAVYASFYDIYLKGVGLPAWQQGASRLMSPNWADLRCPSTSSSAI